MSKIYQILLEDIFNNFFWKLFNNFSYYYINWNEICF